MKKSILKNLFLLLSLSHFYVSVFSQQKTWPLMDRAALAGYLLNPGFDIGYNSCKGKYLEYNCYYDNRHLSKDSLQLVRKTMDFFNFFYFFVLQQQKKLMDSIKLHALHLNGSEKYSWNGTFESFTRFYKLDEENRLLLFLKIVVFPVQYSVAISTNKQFILLELDTKECPQTRKVIDRAHYARMIAWICKDYVINKNSGKFAGIQITYKNGNKDVESSYFDFNDQRVFKDMYDHKLFNKK